MRRGADTNGDPIAVLTCVEGVLDLALARAGNPVVDLITNSGGTATADAVAALITSQARGSRIVVVLHHTGCQFLPFAAEFQQFQRLDTDHELSMQEVGDVALAVAATVTSLRLERRLPFRDDIRGAVYDTARNRLITIPGGGNRGPTDLLAMPWLTRGRDGYRPQASLRSSPRACRHRRA